MSEPRMTGMKTCSHCHRELPVISFPVHKRSSDGLSCWCRGCFRENNKRKYLKHPRRPKFMLEGFEGVTF